MSYQEQTRAAVHGDLLALAPTDLKAYAAELIAHDPDITFEEGHRLLREEAVRRGRLVSLPASGSPRPLTREAVAAAVHVLGGNPSGVRGVS